MIKLTHLKNCPSVLRSPSNLDGAVDFCTDTRKYIPPSAFVAIPGTKVNPLDFISELLSKGCPLVFYQSDDINEAKVRTLTSAFPHTHFVPTSDIIKFLQELTHSHIVEWQSNSRNTVFGISGSNGKTTHKEMLAFILRAILPGKVVATEKNNNNHLGVPLTLLNVGPETEFVVLELGSNHPGEIKLLCDIASPSSGITTNIGATHLEFFGGEEMVFQEEAHLFYAVKENTGGQGTFFLNVDDLFLKQLSPTKGSISYGEADSAMAKVTYFENGAAITHKGKQLVALNESITGKHNKFNIITCAFIAQHFYPQQTDKIIKAASEFRPTKNRSEWIEFDGKKVFLDAYNANPSSMKASLQGFKESVLGAGLKLTDACVVLGDMNELGANASAYHEDVGNYVFELGFTNVYFIGRYADYYQRGNPAGNKRSSSNEFKSEYQRDCIKKFSIHFIKGSRSLQLESLFDIT